MELSEEEKKAIKDFLELREIHSNDSMTISYLSIYQNAVKKMSNLVEQQQKEIDDYKSQKEEWFDLYNERVSDILKLEQEVEDLKEDSITKDKIREKIATLEKEIETNSLYEENWNKIEVLKELLEEN